MPYKSKAQEAYMHINHPEIAKRWDKEHNTPHDLPEHVSNHSMSHTADVFREVARQTQERFKVK